nr:hypothetical protein [Pseudonocardia humida]
MAQPRDRADQDVDVGVPGHVVEPDAVHPAQRRERGRQVARARHVGPVEQDGHHRLAQAECLLDLDPHVVDRVLEPGQAPLVLRGEPLLADQDEHDGARPDRIEDALGGVDTRVEGVHVHEHLPPAEVGAQPVRDAARGVAAVRAAVAHEDP